MILSRTTCSEWILKFVGSAYWKIFTYLLMTYKADGEILRHRLAFFCFTLCFSEILSSFCFNFHVFLFLSTFWRALMRIFISSDVSFLWRKSCIQHGLIQLFISLYQKWQVKLLKTLNIYTALRVTPQTGKHVATTNIFGRQYVTFKHLQIFCSNSHISLDCLKSL